LQAAATRQDSAAARQARLAAADAAFAPGTVEILAKGEDAAGPGGGGVARYLRPEAEAVRFWPRPELAGLLEWVAADQRVAVGLVTGAGGAGRPETLAGESRTTLPPDRACLRRRSAPERVVSGMTRSLSRTL
jgi:hypothetical protein